MTFASNVPILSAPVARRNLAQPWTLSYERDDFGTLRAEYDLAPNVTAWGAYGAREGRESTDLANPTVTDSAGDMTSYRFQGTRTDHISSGEVGVRVTLATGPVVHNLVASAARYHGKSDARLRLLGLRVRLRGRSTAISMRPWHRHRHRSRR